MHDERRLIEEARTGSLEAFTGLLRLHQAPLRAYLAGFIRNVEAVDDVAQEAFFGAYRSLDGYKGESSFRTWLFAIAKNQALLHLREEARRRSHRENALRVAVTAWLTSAADADAKDGNALEARLQALEGCVGSLPKASASMLTDYYLNRRSTRQIAQQTGRSEISIWKTLSRIRQALRQCIELKTSAGAAGP